MSALAYRSCDIIIFQQLSKSFDELKLDGLNSGWPCYFYIYGKKTENKEYEIECASNLVEL